MVAGAAVVSVVRGVAGRSDGSHRAKAVAASTPAVATTATSGVPIGSVLRLPNPPAGALNGALLIYSEEDCRPLVSDLAHVDFSSAGNMTPTCKLWVSPDGGTLAVLPHGDELATAAAIAGLAK